MIDVLRAEWSKLRGVVGPVVAISLVVALVFGVGTFVVGLGVGAVALPLHEHMLQASDTVFYPISTERGPQLDAGTMAFLTAAAVTFALGLIFLIVWTAATLVLANLLLRRRAA